jgi:hypothetical protein
MIKKFWNLCGDMKVNFWLMFAISINLAIGSFYVKWYPKVFSTLNYSLVQDWFAEFGKNQLAHIWWLALLFTLAFFLGITTLVCIIKRVNQLWPQRKQLGFRFFSVRLSPSLIHLCFLIILLGHFSSLVIGYNQSFPLQLKQKITLPDGKSVEAIDQRFEYYDAPEAIIGTIKQCTVVLKIKSQKSAETKKLSILHPIHWEGLSIHLDYFIKKEAESDQAIPELKIIVKKDPGVTLVILCFIILCLLMFWYFPQRRKI